MYCYFGHHKCASTWMIGILYDLCGALGLKTIEIQSVKVDDLNQYVLSRNTDFYISQTSKYLKIKTIKNFKAFHLIRDPRDIVVSSYYSHRYTHLVNGWEELQQHRSELEQLDKDEGILRQITFAKQFIDNIGDWNYNDQDILELKTEYATTHSVEALTAICKFLSLLDEEDERLSYFKVCMMVNKFTKRLGLPFYIKNTKVSKKFISYLANKNSFKKLSGGRNPGEENINSHYRKGLQGDWRNHFNLAHKQEFKALYGDLVVRLGYETDNNW